MSALRSRELDEPNALVERIAVAVHEYILATEPQTTGASIVAVIRGFIRTTEPHIAPSDDRSPSLTQSELLDLFDRCAAYPTIREAIRGVLQSRSQEDEWS